MMSLTRLYWGKWCDRAVFRCFWNHVVSGQEIEDQGSGILSGIIRG